MTQKRKNLLKAMAIGAGIAVVIFAWRMFFGAELLMALCDGCFVTAVLLAGFGGLVFTRNQGTFDALSYGVKSVVKLHFPRKDTELEPTLYDYQEKKKKERKGANHFLWAGLIYLLLSLLLLAVFGLA